MKRILMAVMSVAVAMTFSTPAFSDEDKDKKDEKKGGHVFVYNDEKSEKKEEKKGSYVGTFGEEKKDEKKKDGY